MDGIAALGRARRRTLGDTRVGRRARVMIADGWDLPGNLGTLIRCADGAGASGVLVAGQGFGLSHPLVLKASMGAALAVPVVAIGRPAARRWLRERGFRIIAADPAGRRSYRDVDHRGPLAIVAGSERRGLAREWLTAADNIVAIPMLGISASLNAAVAGALLLYEPAAAGLAAGLTLADAVAQGLAGLGTGDGPVHVLHGLRPRPPLRRHRPPHYQRDPTILSFF
jgi:TrmH family RNA methyltransferase